MTTPYDELRKEAREKRDRIIENAKQEYRVTVRRIQSLRRMVTGKAPPHIRPPRPLDEKPLADKLAAVLPKDRSFTIAEAVVMLYTDPTCCRYKETSVRAQFPRLLERGILRQVGRRNGHILWASPEADVEVAAFGTMTLPDIATMLIQELGSMRVAEIVCVMKERGYKPQEPKGVTYQELRRAMVRVGGRFSKDEAGRWYIAETKSHQ